jgi:hypothetical protein
MAVMWVTIYKVANCRACQSLVAAFRRVFGQVSKPIALDVIEVTDELAAGTTLASRIKAYPTVIASLDGVPALGWEGFATMAPEEIQDAMVLDVLRQAESVLAAASATPGAAPDAVPPSLDRSGREHRA